MGYFMFYVAVITACLLWSATFTASAARTERLWLRRLLVAVAVIVPALSLVPFVFLTGLLAFGSRPLQTNWFGPTLTAALSALIGGIWIAIVGLSRPAFTSHRVAAQWPLIGLAAMFVAAKAVTFGILLLIENAATARAPFLRLEAASIMQANLPPAVADADNAATLYRPVFEMLRADKAIDGNTSPLISGTTDPNDPAVTELLDRHASTLALLRRAADREQCRFVRDWTRPSVDLRLPEILSLRTCARLLALAARGEAAAGKNVEALGDVARILRIGRQAANEPFLISSLVGMAIDKIALETLTGILPRLRKTDLPLLDEPGLGDALATVPPLGRALLGEETLGLASFADVADGTRGIDLIPLLTAVGPPPPPAVGQPLLRLTRGFLLPGDIAGYRSLMKSFQQVAGDFGPYSEIKKSVDAIDTQLAQRSPGIFTSLLLPALGNVFRARSKSEAVHRSAAVLVAATKERLEGGALPETLENLLPKQLAALPRDPFADDQPLLLKNGNATWTVYSVGPDGEDDGGPPAPGAEKVEGNDDVGLRMAL